MATAEYLRASNSKRFVIEDSITKVTSDGEPHEMMTMIAVVSGLITASVILAILVSLVGCRKSGHNDEEEKSENGSRAPSLSHVANAENSNHSSILTIYQPQKFQLGANNECKCGKNSPKTNLQGNLNAAFETNEFPLRIKGDKPKKKAHWPDELDEGLTAANKPKDTSIMIEERI